jgi:CDP-paratose synthetase
LIKDFNKPLTGAKHKKTILITGATGFLGSSLAKKISPLYQCVLLKRSTSLTTRIDSLLKEGLPFFDLDKVPLKKIFEAFSFDAVIHCATNYGRRTLHPIDIIEANLILPLRILHFASEAGVKNFLNTDTILDKRINDYSLSKRQFREWFEGFADRICCTNVAIEHFYGPFDDQSKFVSWVIGALISNAPKLDLTEGLQRRDFVYIDDVVTAFQTILEHQFTVPNGYYTFEIGSGETIEIRELVNLVKLISGNTTTKLNFGAIPYRKNEIMTSSVQLETLLALGWRPCTSLLAGLEKTVAMEINQSKKMQRKNML